MDAPLTPQQRFDRFLALCSKGLYDKQIAYELGMSLTYVAAARRVLGVPNSLKCSGSTARLASRNAAIVEALKSNPKLSRKLIAKQFGVNVATIYNLAFRNKVPRQRTPEAEVQFQ